MTDEAGMRADPNPQADRSSPGMAMDELRTGFPQRPQDAGGAAQVLSPAPGKKSRVDAVFGQLIPLYPVVE